MFPRPQKRYLSVLCEKAVELAGSGIGKTLSLNFVSAGEMAEINAAYVGHSGPTDVICFDYRETKGDLPQGNDDDEAEAEIIICPVVAFAEAGKRALPYAREMVLYLVHGLLHAAGEDDLKPELKRKMRRREKSVMNELEKDFVFEKIFPKPVQTGIEIR